MPIGFYGFDFGGFPKTSRLFNPQVMNKAQQAYNTGFGQFQQFDPNAVSQQVEAPDVPRSQGLAGFLGDERFRSLGGESSLAKRDDGTYELNSYIKRGTGGTRGGTSTVRVDDQGNLLDNRDESSLKPHQLDAYYRLLAQMNRGAM